jgi:hypothetical protein
MKIHCGGMKNAPCIFLIIGSDRKAVDIND